MPPEDRARRIETLEQKLAEMERELATLRAGARRALVQQALMDERLITLEQNRLFRWWNQLYRAAANLYARFGSDPNYGGLSDLRTPGDYARWISHQEWELEREKIAADWQYQPRFSILLTSEDGREASLRSLEAQCYGNWGLEPGGDYVMELRAGDVLSPYALHFFAQALQRERPVMLYSDEDRIGSDGIRTDPMFKPGWSPELLRSTAYLGRSMVYRSDAKSAWTEAKAEVRHIPRVLYHGRTEHDLTVHGERTIARKTSGLSVIVCSRDVGRVRKCLGAVRRTRASDCEMIVVHHLEAGDGEQMRRCAEDLGAKWIPYRGAFHFSRMNNLGARKASAAVLLFLNDDVVVEAAGWDRTIAGALERSEIGIAGAILEYPNGTIQHAGIVAGMGDAVGHCGRFQMTSELWPWLRMTREVSAVTGAMLGIRADLFHEIGGFDERFSSNYNDVDLCFRVRERGLRVLSMNVGRAVHRESQTRVAGTRHGEREALYERWAARLAQPDAFYSIHLAPVERIALRSGGMSGLSCLSAGA